MSISRQFVVNELRTLGLSFYPDGQRDNEAVEHLREAIRLLSRSKSEARPASEVELIRKAS